jgi:hypothetical protein
VEARQDAKEMPGINAEQTRFPDLATGTGSSWGEAIAILGSMASDAASIYGLADQPIPAALVTAETLGSVVSDAKVWEELLRTRQDSDTRLRLRSILFSYPPYCDIHYNIYI